MKHVTGNGNTYCRSSLFWLGRMGDSTLQWSTQAGKCQHRVMSLASLLSAWVQIFSFCVITFDALQYIMQCSAGRGQADRWSSVNFASPASTCLCPCITHRNSSVSYLRLSTQLMQASSAWNLIKFFVDSSWNMMAHGDVQEGKWRRKLANGLGSQYPSHYLGTWCIQHYYRWCAHLGCQ